MAVMLECCDLFCWELAALWVSIPRSFSKYYILLLMQQGMQATGLGAHSIGL